MYDPRQMALMQQMFRSPDGAQAPIPQGGIGMGAGAGIGPMTGGPDMPQGGIQDLPAWDPSQDPGFQNLPYGGEDPGIVPMDADGMQGNGPVAPGGWSPAARGGQSRAMPMPARPGQGIAKPMPLIRPSQPPMDQMDNSTQMPHRQPPRFGGNGAYPKDLGGGVQGAGSMADPQMRERARQALIQSIMAAQGGR